MGRTWWDALAPAASPWRIRKKRGRHAVEMTRRGKRGKLQKQRRVSHASLRAWKSGEKQKRRIPTFPQRRRRRELDDSGGEENTNRTDHLLRKADNLMRHARVDRLQRSPQPRTAVGHDQEQLLAFNPRP